MKNKINRFTVNNFDLSQSIKKEILNEKEIVLNKCKTEPINENTYLYYDEMEYGVPPLCGGVVGEWSWSNDLSTLYKHFIQNTLWNYVAKICEYKEYAIQTKSPFELLLEYEDDFLPNISNKKVYEELKNLMLNIKTNCSYAEFNDFANNVIRLINKLGHYCDFKLYKNSNEALKLVKEHYGKAPIYGETLFEIFKNDNNC